MKNEKNEKHEKKNDNCKHNKLYLRLNSDKINELNINYH